MASYSRTAKPESLPPTDRAAMFNAYCVYFQLQKWNTAMESTLDSKDEGWRLENASLVPVTTDE